MNDAARASAVGGSSRIPSTRMDRRVETDDVLDVVSRASDLVRRGPEPFVDAEEAGRFLSITPRRAKELARKGILPAHPLGDGFRKVWRFRLSELAAALCERRVDYVRQSPAPRQETI